MTQAPLFSFNVKLTYTDDTTKDFRIKYRDYSQWLKNVVSKNNVKNIKVT